MENLVGYAQTDLVVPAAAGWSNLAQANTAARDWCAEVNAAVHSEIAAAPAARLSEEVKGCCVRCPACARRSSGTRPARSTGLPPCGSGRRVLRFRPGLYFLGLWFLSAFTSSLLGGVGSDADHIAEQIATRHPDGRPAVEVLTTGARRPG